MELADPEEIAVAQQRQHVEKAVLFGEFRVRALGKAVARGMMLLIIGRIDVDKARRILENVPAVPIAGFPEHLVDQPHVDAPILEGSPLVVECELRELVRTEHFSTVVGTIVDVAAEESVLGETGKANAEKLGVVLYDSFSNRYFTLGEKVGKAWSEGKRYLSARS